MKVFLDSGAIIGVQRMRDEHHPRAGKIFDELKQRGAALFLSNHVLEEVVTFLQAKEGSKKAFEIGRRILESQEITIFYTHEDLLKKALDRVRKYAGLSLCDAVTTLLMEENDIAFLFSFDYDFDRFETIRRLH